jgi:hypothetical protein
MGQREGQQHYCTGDYQMTKKTHNYRKAHDAHVQEWLDQPVVRVNLMSGKEYVEARRTPVYCSPSCESYWSM